MPYVTYRRVVEARTRFRELAMLLPHKRQPVFDEYVGFTLPRGWHPDKYVFWLNDEEVTRVEHLLSPHSETIFKAWIARMRKCKYGHNLTPANTYVTTNGAGRESKACKLCRANRRKLKYRQDKLNAQGDIRGEDNSAA